MSPKRKTSALRVHFTNTVTSFHPDKSRTTLPFFLTSNGISGLVETASLGVAVDSLRITLDGGINIRIPQRQSLGQCGIGAASSYKRMNTRTFTVTRTLNVGSASSITSFPFHLDITTGNSHDCSRRAPAALPPTLFFKTITSSPTSTEAETTEITSSYTLSISAMIQSSVVETVSLPVRLYDNSHVHPPAYQAPTVPNYAGRQTSTFRRNLVAKAGTFSAATLGEPVPMVFTPENDFATTSIPLQLTAETKSVFSELDTSITWRLRSYTLGSLMPMHTCPTMRQARSAPSNMISASSLGLKHNIKMQLKDWRHADGMLSSRQDLAIALPKSALLIPTTHTEHISRHYAVQVEICVRSKDTGKASVCIEIPLQIGYQHTSDVEAPRYEEWEERAYLFKPEEQTPQFEARNMSPPPEYT